MTVPMDYRYYPGPNYTYSQAVGPGFASVGNPVNAAGIAATSNQSSQAVGISVNISPPETYTVSTWTVLNCVYI